MDVSEYLPMFLAEAREHLQELNLAVVRIEENPDDRETVDEIFRVAHSLKGMSATMGFAQIAKLTHGMEDVFELLRQRRGGLGRAAIDALLECLDALDAAVGAIESEGAERLDPEPLVERLRALVGERRPPQRREPVPGTPEVVKAVAHARRVVNATVRLDDEVLMPSVRAFMVLAAAAEHGELLGSVPAEAEVDDFDGRVVEVWLASEHEEADIASALAAVPDVADASVRESERAEETRASAGAVRVAAGAPGRTPGGAPAQGKGGAASGTQTVRVQADRLDGLMHLMGELVVHRTHVEALASQVDVPGLQGALQDLTRSSQALQAMVMQVRMVPVEAVLLRFPRLVRDLSTKLGKQVELVLEGKETELDRTVVDMLGDPLVHLVRNALDHGLEPPEERLRAGKPPTGTLAISARHAGGNVVITVSDDGRGIDPARVARKAAERGLVPADAVASVDMARAVELLFEPGFSTAEETSDISGRGVGMDAVREAIRNLGGELVTTSEVGGGTTAAIRLPLTLAIVAALLVEADGLPFAIPLDRVERTLRLADHPVRRVAGAPKLMLRDGVLPLLDLARALGHAGGGERGHAVVVRAGEQRLTLAVDALVGQRELVTRALPPEVGGAAGLSGGAVLSNGEIALIVDCDVLGSRERLALSQLAKTN